MAAMIFRPRIMREVWRCVFGDDLEAGKQTGPDQFRTLCPYHNEREPSCDVSIDKGTFLCRSCGAAGGILDVVVRSGDAKSRSEAITWLKNRGVSVC